MIRALLVLGLVGATGCSTIIRPTKPDTLLAAQGDPVAGLRFDGEETVLREPGMPLSPSRSWQREVSNYTATTLNTVLSTKEDAPAVHTVVSFDMASPSVIQIGTWKEMTIILTSTLPDGTVVKSQPVIANIDDPVEYGLMTAASVGGTVLNATGTIAIILFFFTGANDVPLGVVAIGSLVGGIVLSIAQSVGQYFVASNEEKRWSNLYTKALTEHAKDVRKAWLSPHKPPLAPPPSTAPPPIGSPPPSSTSPATVKPGPTDPSETPPPLLGPPAATSPTPTPKK
jgi:hypothetical protein